MPLVPALRVGAVQAGANNNGVEVAIGTVISNVAQGNGLPGTSPVYNPGSVQPVTPSVPASTVAATNPNAFPVSVVVTGGTLTAVVVNGVQVGTTAGTYIVPGNGTISITYSVAPTWAWSNAVTGSAAAVTNTNTTYTAGQTVPVAAVAVS
jgi:hypothetical protein